MHRLKILLFQVSIFLICLAELSLLQKGTIKVDAIKSKFGCQNMTISLHCKQPEVIKIVGAMFDRKQGMAVCITGKDDSNNAMYCKSVDKKSLASDSCDRKVNCNITVTHSTINDHCSPYLTVLYKCEMPPSTIPVSTSTNILTTPKKPSTPRTTNGPSQKRTTSSVKPPENYGFITYGGASICKHHGFLVGSLLFILLL